MTDGVERSGATRAITATWTRRFADEVHPMTAMAMMPRVPDVALSAVDLGPLRLARLSGEALLLQRSTRECERRAVPTFLLLLLLGGGADVTHYGKVASLAEGDMILCDGAAPLSIQLDARSNLMVLRIPSAMLREHLPSPTSCCGQLLSGQAGLTLTAATMIRTLFDQLEIGLALNYQDRVARHLLDVVATAYALAIHNPDARSSIVSARCAAVKLFIEQHLRDPDLSPCSIAARLKLSTRYLRLIFASENETVSAYILRRRLEQCARQIADPAWRGHSMIEIAFGWGFNSAPHFTRTFRDRYAMPPREYRRLKLDGGTSAHRPSPRPLRAEAKAA